MVDYFFTLVYSREIAHTPANPRRVNSHVAFDVKKTRGVHSCTVTGFMQIRKIFGVLNREGEGLHFCYIVVTL